jgi:hypothetical protein
VRKLSVDVFADKSRPEGGHAVIRLNGLERLPDSLTFRLKPVDSAQQGDGGWPADDRHPLVTRLTAEGAELVVGPDIVENPIFLPGTLTAIEIQTCGVRGEFLWPRIPPLLRPKRRHLLGSNVTRDSKNEDIDTIVFNEAIDASSDVPPQQAADSGTNELGTTAASGTKAAGRQSIELVAGSALLLPSAATDIGSATRRLNGATDLAGAPDSSTSASPRDSTDTNAAANQDAKLDVVWSEKPPVVYRQRTWKWAAVSAAAVLFAAFSIPKLLEFAGASPAKASRESEFTALLSVGTTSPRGVRTRERSSAELLEAADTLLHAPGGSRDKAEAAFMLRRYLATTLSDERTLLALTQLGSIYAEPDGARAPDYPRARQLWEIAAVLGDPVAMCFLASLNEHGLGLAPNKPVALQWYLRAKDAGGCQRIDESIARLRK